MYIFKKIVSYMLLLTYKPILCIFLQIHVKTTIYKLIQK